MNREQARSNAIELHIEELVLHGFAPGDRERIGEAVERELARLVAEQGTPDSWEQGGAIEDLNAGTFHVTANKPDIVGTQIAQAVHRSVGR
jgi:hypothetical protein